MTLHKYLLAFFLLFHFVVFSLFFFVCKTFVDGDILFGWCIFKRRMIITIILSAFCRLIMRVNGMNSWYTVVIVDCGCGYSNTVWYIGGIYCIGAYVKTHSRLYIQNQYIFNYLCSLIYLIKSVRTHRIKCIGNDGIFH